MRASRNHVSGATTIAIGVNHCSAPTTSGPAANVGSDAAIGRSDSAGGIASATTYPRVATPSTNNPATNGLRVPYRSTKAPAGAFATRRTHRFAERITPTMNAEMPSTAPRFGRIGKTTPPPKPTKKVLAITASNTVGGRSIPSSPTSVTSSRRDSGGRIIARHLGPPVIIFSSSSTGVIAAIPASSDGRSTPSASSGSTIRRRVASATARVYVGSGRSTASRVPVPDASPPDVPPDALPPVPFRPESSVSDRSPFIPGLPAAFAPRLSVICRVRAPSRVATSSAAVSSTSTSRKTPSSMPDSRMSTTVPRSSRSLRTSCSRIGWLNGPCVRSSRRAMWNASRSIASGSKTNHPINPESRSTGGRPRGPRSAAPSH